MTKHEKLNKINSLIEQLKELNKDRDFAVFFSAVSIDQDRNGMHQALYTDGQFDEINLAIGTGISVMADQAELQGVNRMDVLESVVSGIGHAEEMRQNQQVLEDIDNDSDDEGQGGIGHA